MRDLSLNLRKMLIGILLGTIIVTSLGKVFIDFTLSDLSGDQFTT